MSREDATTSKAIARTLVCFVLFILLGTGLVTSAFAQTPLAPGSIQVSRVQYDGNSFGNPDSYPLIFNDAGVTGIQGSIWIDQFNSVPASAVAGTVSLPSTGSYISTFPTPEPGSYITTSFSSKSEGALMLSSNGSYLTYMGYQGVDELGGVSNSYSLDPSAQLSPNAPPNYDREVALIAADGSVSLTPIDNTNSGDNPRAAITTDGNEFYIVGNADSTTYATTPISGPGTTIGVRCGIPAYSASYQLGTYFATDRPDESSKQHYKDNNWRGVGIYTDGTSTQQLYVSKGSGGNGDDGVFQVGTSLPGCTEDGTDTNNTIVPLFSAPATDPTTKAPSPYVPFGFWFANPTTLYVADEGYANLDGSGNLIPDPLAGLEKWSFNGTSWQLLYTIQNGLNLYQAQTISGYPVSTYPTGIRNITGAVNGDGTVTIYAITAQYSTISGGEPDPTSLVGITDSLAATTLPANEQFVTLQNSGTPEAYRGVAFIPPASGFTRATQTITFPNPGPVTYGVSPITLTASATSGWPVAYTVISGPATVAGNVLTITGAGSVVVEADQSGNTDYAAAAPKQDTITVNKATQTISVTTPAPTKATYGTSFTVVASASSGLPVNFTNGGSCTNTGGTYTMDSGIGTCSVYMSQLGNGNYLAAHPVTESVVAQLATPTVSLTGAPATAAYGSTFTLIATTNASTSAVITATNPATCSLSGSSSPDTVMIIKGSGTCIFTAAWAADNNYAAASTSALTKADKQSPVITWATPAAIPAGTALSSTQLDASANVAGSFVYSPPAGTVLAAGVQTLSATFTPTDTVDYATVTDKVSLQVNASTIVWATPAAIVYGTPLSGTQLDATANVPGSFVYTPATGTVLTAGSQPLMVTFTPTDTVHYPTATAKVTLKVTKATSVASWTTPAAITYGTPLGATQLDATANVPGNFSYVPASGTVLKTGSHTLSATFTPTDTTDYTNASAKVTQQVLQTTTTTTITSASSTVTMNASGVATAVLDYNVTSYKPLGSVSLTASTGEVCSGTLSPTTGNGSYKLTFTTTGTRTIIATYGGDTNHLGSNSSSQSPAITVTVNPH